MVKKSLRQFTLMATATVHAVVRKCAAVCANGGRTAKTCRIRAAVGRQTGCGID